MSYEIVEAAILQAEQRHKQENDPTSKYWGYRLYAQAAVEALKDSGVRAGARRALRRAGWEERLSDNELDSIVDVVLRSVGDAR